MLNAVVTLDDVIQLALADRDHFYELSPEGILTVAPPPDHGHQIIASQILQWLATNGYGDRVSIDSGIAIAGRAGGRVVDVMVSTGDIPPKTVYVDPRHVRLAVEIVSAGTVDTDRHTKPREYADAGVTHFWRVERLGGEPVVHLFRRRGASYEPSRVCHLAELLAGAPPNLDR
jgi:Uma2 family endonuclease